MKKGIYYLLSTLYFVVWMVACHPPQPLPQLEEPSVPVEYPIGYMAQNIETNVSDTNELYLLQEEFLENFLKVHTQYQGAHPTVATDFPSSWGVVLVERLPEGRELYQIQSFNREWVYLVITSGFGTQRILDVLPVAANLAFQTEDILETEIWTTERETDGVFTVVKKYEWIHSVKKVTQKEYEANPQNYLRAQTITDKYLINNSCRFERIEVAEVPDYAAVVFYYKENKPEDWDEIIDIFKAFCEDYEILFAEIHSHFNQISLYDYKLNYITELDITPYMDLSEGVVFMKKEKAAKSVPFGSYERIISEIKRYFKIVEL